MGKNDKVINLLNEGMKTEYGTLFSYPHWASLAPNEEVKSKIELLGRVSIEHANIVAGLIKRLGGMATVNFPTINKRMSFSEFLKFQKEVEKKAMETYTQCSKMVEEGELKSQLENLSRTERKHMDIVEDIINTLNNK